jgi:lipoprotein-releasing system ATP-binding protein
MAEALAPALQLKNVARSYQDAHGKLDVFTKVNLTVAAGEIVALVGPSGAGKSSLLHIAGLLERPTEGEAYIAGRNCTALDDKARTRVRRIGIGFIYQFHHLLPEFDALENVVIPQLIASTPRPAAMERGRELLVRLGLADRLDHRPAQLSGGASSAALGRRTATSGDCPGPCQ